MAGFASPDAFYPETSSLQLLPVRFERLAQDRFLVGNIVGDMAEMTASELSRLCELDLRPGDGLYERAFEKLFIGTIEQPARLQLLALRLRSRLSFLRAATPLHLFVVTLRCEHSCPYCQVSRQSKDRVRYDMDEATASKALDIALSAPAPLMKIEFQGGEPLLNFDLIRWIVLAAKQRAAPLGKQLQFVIATNLALLNEDVLDFCAEHEILLSTSLDGPRDLHNENRPRRGQNSYELAVAGIARIKERLGSDMVGALMTTTEASLDRVEEIVDEYIRQGLNGIFLRPLSPYGFAIKTRQFHKYGAQEWLQFWKRGLRYILEINKSGHHFPEFYSSLLLRRMLSDEPIGYVDLRSPAGIGLGALVYNYDGTVFASDEARMLAEMGDRRFELGNVRRHSYRELVLSDTLVAAVADSLTQTAPQCSSCVFEPNCGADPVYHYATQNDVLGIKPLSEFCERQKGIITHLFELLEHSPGDAAVLRRWAS
ncbi:His-Xaa-Ser system radical SAM maturase HxsB [Mycolicibacterium holsaticum]|uniref:His-Xaa-Ser system radical SAM maturase HxsB n=1 Tax=Mycolicibacterium holsaticum TaxID=152142 RepID=A0A1E3R816_9MYCO|nr:His-Xaa-Ser system radical SAM maturase HxsB [Mycolicibacterium holsaticum]ODQ85522.1 His-Xaa-Ser system radical SAM maturase HxsB [Mycolicibacterium holsaticum]